MEILPQTADLVMGLIYENDMTILGADGTKISLQDANQKILQLMRVRDQDGNKVSHSVDSVLKFPFKELKKIEKEMKVTFGFIPDIIDYDNDRCCHGIRKCNGLYVPCGTRVKSGETCKVCAKTPGSEVDFTRRMCGNLGQYNKLEVGMMTCIAKQKSKETKVKEEVETYAIEKMKECLQKIDKKMEDLDKYHTTIDWDKVNLSGKRGRPQRKTKPVVTHVGICACADDIDSECRTLCENIGFCIKEAVPENIPDPEEVDHGDIKNQESDKDDDDDEDDDDDTEEVDFIEIKYTDGKTYYLDEEDANVFERGGELVGTWDSKSKKIIFIED